MRKWLCLSCLFVTASLWLPVFVDGEMRWGSGLSDLEAACDCLYHVGKNATPRHGRMFVMAESAPSGREKRTLGTECHAPRHGRMFVMAESAPSGEKRTPGTECHAPARQNVCDGGKRSKRGNAPLAQNATRPAWRKVSQAGGNAPWHTKRGTLAVSAKKCNLVG